jgi:hypothetical protein
MITHVSSTPPPSNKESKTPNPSKLALFLGISFVGTIFSLYSLHRRRVNLTELKFLSTEWEISRKMPPKPHDWDSDDMIDAYLLASGKGVKTDTAIARENRDQRLKIITQRILSDIKKSQK